VLLNGRVLLFDRLSPFFFELQDRITSKLEEIETADIVDPLAGSITPAKFQEDVWKGDALGGGGRTRVLEGGRVIERGGVNVSDVHGVLAPELAEKMPGSAKEFRAAGISLVLHPRNPNAPTVHANFRMLCRGNPASPEKLWFGGGGDLTPIYLVEEDAFHFHSVWKKVCDEFSDVASYTKMKEDCDRYFYLPHRQEARGIGGIFYDYVENSPDRMAEFTRRAGSAFLDAYVPILARRASEPYTSEERDFQLWRRGRYVEFNLVYDRGTQFGLKTGGRIESILMSLPPYVKYSYNYQPANAREKEILSALKEPRSWVRENS
jgi:coproporphyrinogen III oxidase